MQVAKELLRELNIDQVADVITLEQLYRSMRRKTDDKEIEEIQAMTQGGHSQMTNTEPPVCSMACFSDELGSLLRPGRTDEMSTTLCTWWDAPKNFGYSTKHEGEDKLTNVYFSIVAAVTPIGLSKIFSKDLMHTGIGARMLFIYCDDVQTPVWGDSKKPNEALYKDLKMDLIQMKSIRGEYTFEPEANEFMLEWWKTKHETAIHDPRFATYNVRRHTNHLKLMMLVAASQQNELAITLKIAEKTKAILLEAEKDMPKAFSAMAVNTQFEHQGDAIRAIDGLYKRYKKPTLEAPLRRMLSEHIKATEMDKFLDSLVLAGLVECLGQPPNREFYPRGKHPMKGTAK